MPQQRIIIPNKPKKKIKDNCKKILNLKITRPKKKRKLKEEKRYKEQTEQRKQVTRWEV